MDVKVVVTDSSEDKEKVSSKKKEVWTVAEMNKFLTIWSENIHRIQQIGPKRDLYRELAAKLSDEGVHKTGEQFKKKIENMKNLYNKYKPLPGQQSNWRYYEQVDKLLKYNPTYIRRPTNRSAFNYHSIRLLSSNRNPVIPVIQTVAKPAESRPQILTKVDAKNMILNAKRQSNLTFEEMSRRLGVNKVWLTSAIYGEHPFEEEMAINTLELIGFNDKESQEFKQLSSVMKEIPEIRGLDHEKYATDPLISRLYEVLRVYGPTFKALASEECGNGILSAIDCRIDFDKYFDKSTKSERLVIKIDGKFLEYKS